MTLAWLAEHWSGVAALLFTGFGFWSDVRVRRAQTGIDITKHHRELWSYFFEHPEFAGLVEDERDMEKKPLTTPEKFFANLALQHLRATFYASRSWIYVQPEHLPDEIRAFFSKPAVRLYWQTAQERHDRAFARFVDRQIRRKR